MRYLGILLTSFLVMGGELPQFISEGKLLLNLRLRMEAVDVDDGTDSAFATTLAGRLGFQTGNIGNVSFLVEFEGTSDLSNDRYDSTSNGQYEYPVVADPVDAELNRAQMVVKPSNGHQLIIGRQRIKLDNDRFVGNVGWRQNEQTFDALLYENSAIQKTKITLAYLDNANRIFGANHPSSVAANTRLEGIIGHGNMKFSPYADISIFAHLMEMKDKPDSSHKNFGFLWKGKAESFFWDVSFATQSDYADGLDTNEADYMMLGFGNNFSGHNLSINYEVLGGDGFYGFQTPFATLHAFNGWTDLFLGTPKTGLKDLFVKYNAKWGPVAAVIMAHQYKSDEGSDSLGHELNFQLTGKFANDWSWGAKNALYLEDGYRTDTAKVWAWVGFKL